MQLLSSGGQLCYSVSGIWQISHYYPQMSFRFNSAGVERMGTICFHFKMTKKKKSFIKINIQGLGPESVVDRLQCKDSFNVCSSLSVL